MPLSARVAAALAAFLLVAPPALAQPHLLFMEGPFVNYDDPTTNFNARLTTLFGGAAILPVTGGNDLSNLNNGIFTAAIVANRIVSGSGGPLSAPQTSALQTFIAAGHRVLLIGEYPDAAWNQSLASLVGGGIDDGPLFKNGPPGGIQCFNPAPWGSSPATPAITHLLTQDVETVYVPCAGGVAGGTSVFDVSFAALFGPQQNVLFMRDQNTFEDFFQTEPRFGDNRQFALNVAEWLYGTTPAATVPEPSTVALTAGGLLALAGVARRRAAREVSRTR